MKITILLFAQLKDVAGKSSIELELSGGTVKDALDVLCKEYPALEPYLQRVQTAWNEEYCKADAPLEDGGTLALIPPVSGGMV
jgi:molybdopterin synthase sulfur carrier subunit